jgi:hypothetical protein
MRKKGEQYDPISFLGGYVTAKIESIAASSPNITSDFLAEGLANILSPHRQNRSSDNSLPSLRLEAPKRGKRGQALENRRYAPRGKASTGKGPKKGTSNNYWASMTAEERSAEMQRRQDKAKAKREAKRKASLKEAS